MMWETLERFLRGRFTRVELKRVYLPFITIVVYSLLLIAYLLYPPELNYSIFTDTISGLGDFAESPIGWWGFSLAMWALCIGFIPLILYTHRRLKAISVTLARLGP